MRDYAGATVGQTVSIVDITMPFGSMVAFMVKWAIASIPAFLILAALGWGLLLLFVGIAGEIGDLSKGD